MSGKSLEMESAFLLAVEAVLSKAMGLDKSQITIDADETIPAIAGKQHIVVSPGGIARGPRSSPTTKDRYLSCRVACIQRSGDIPRDRAGSIFLRRLDGLNDIADKVSDILEGNYSVLATANKAMALETGQGFVEPMMFTSIDDSPQPVFAEAFAGQSHSIPGTSDIVGIKRTIRFSGARFIQCRAR